MAAFPAMTELSSPSVPGEDPLAPPLRDAQGRVLSYLRLSLTTHCDLKCAYCAPAVRAGGTPIDVDEIVRLVTVFARMGVRRVRLTGGEPTVRKDLVDVVRRIAGVPGIAEQCMTTNAQRLARLAAPLLDAGLSRLNVSLDSLDPDRFSRLTGGGDLGRALGGIDAALRAGFRGTKLNTVVMRSVNDDEVVPIIRFAWSRGLVPRFIECMPFGEGRPVPTLELVESARAAGLRLAPHPASAARGAGPSEYWRGEGGDVGFIGPMTRRFCPDCNRVRVSAAGELRACLGGRDIVPLAPLLRSGADDRDIALAVRAGLALKPEGHHMDGPAPRRLLDPMMSLGG